MKKYIIATVLALLVLSCADYDIFEDDHISVEVITCFDDISGRRGPTRVIDADPDSESVVTGLQIMVFHPDGRLDGYSSGSGNSLTVRCSSGKRIICAVANAPSLDGIPDLGSLRNEVSRLTDNSYGNLVMTGEVTSTLTPGCRLSVKVSRICAKVVLSRVRKEFESSALQSRPFTINRIYMTNVAGEALLFGAKTPGIWYNRMGCEPDTPQLIIDEVGRVISDIYDHSHTFYVYPNPTVSDTEGGAWCPRHTRLVIDACVGDDRCWYVVDMPPVERNKAYILEDLLISRMGSDDEESESEDAGLCADFDVIPWTAAGGYTENI